MSYLDHLATVPPPKFLSAPPSFNNLFAIKINY